MDECLQWFILNSFHCVSPCSRLVRNSSGRKEKREHGIKGDQITVSRGFKSQRLSDHIRKLVHYSLCVLTWIPNLIHLHLCYLKSV